tara:strand:+ start:2856 stop:3641 length:786 start_codon:yes stop_codon:yes gene_type:complete
MSRPIPEAYYKAQLDKAMQNNDTKKISSLMKKLQSLNARKATKVKDAPMPTKGRRRRPTPMPMPPRRRRRPTPDPKPRERAKGIDRPQRRRPTAEGRPMLPRKRSYSEKYYVKGEKGFDPNNPLKKKPIKRRRTPTPMPMPPRGRRRRPTSEAQRQRQEILRRRALARARARQRALLRGLPKGSNPRTRGQMSPAKMKQAMERYLKEANKKSPSRLKKAHATAKAKLVSKTQEERAKNYQRGKNPPPPPKPSKKRRELSYS